MSANASAILACLLLTMLCACTDDALPEWMTGVPSQTELDASKGTVVMPAAATANQPYPNLADVPLRPRPYVLPAQRVDEVKNLKRENTDGQGA
ncbi:MAG: hypothetical protein HY053_05270, partial [Proteobacteria bacterium]|nr:hypothetical protein [Pseudomonadota bacterium]